MIYELTLVGRYFDQQIINRFNYVSEGVGAGERGAFPLVSAFGCIPGQVSGQYPDTGIFFQMLSFVSTSMIWDEVVVKALYDVLDFYTLPFIPPATGTEGLTPGLSPAIAYGFRTSRVRQDVDRGTKRLAGVVEGAVEAGGVINGTYLASMNELATRMGATLTYNDEGNTITFIPCILKKQKYTTPSGRSAYRQYPTLAEQEQNLATGFLWQPYNTTRTQTSRQYGRGA